MKPIVEVISSALMMAIIPVLLFIYLFILFLLAIAEMFFYIFDRADHQRTNLIKKFLNPLQKR